MATSTFTLTKTSTAGHTSEPTLRQIAAWLLIFFSLMSTLGLPWDEEWHRSVGRDQFFTPPHILLYSSTALVGILCVVMVLWDTVRYRRGLGADETNTVSVFGLFHAPLGFVVTGFGALTTALAAPLDNYWHELYGIDVILWAPFHMMGAMGGIIARLGMVFVWASVLVTARRAYGHDAAKIEAWGLVLILATVVQGVLALAAPGIINQPTTDVAGLQVMTYPLLLAIGLPFCFVLVKRVVGWPWCTTITILLIMAQTLIIQLFVPWAVRTGAELQGLAFRSPAVVPRFSASQLTLELLILAIAMGFDPLVRLPSGESKSRITLVGIGTASALWLMATVIAHFAATRLIFVRLATTPLGVHIPAPASAVAIMLALPGTLAIGVLSSWLADGLSSILERSPR